MEPAPVSAHVAEPVATARPSTVALRVVLLAALYFLVAAASIELNNRAGQLSPLWVPSAIALVAVYRWGSWLAIGAGIGEFAAGIYWDAAVDSSILLGLANATEALIAAWLLHRIGFCSRMERSRDVGTLLVAGAVGAAASATIAVVSLIATGPLRADQFVDQWILFWASVVLGVILAGSLLFVWVLHPPRPRLRALQIGEVLLLGSLLAIIGLRTLGADQPEFVFMTFPLLAWAALRFGIRGATAACAGLTVLVTWIELGESSTLATLDHTHTLQAVQAMLAGVAIASMLTATLLAERDVARRSAEDVAAMLADAQALVRIGSWELDLGASHAMRWSMQLRRMLGAQLSTQPTLSDLLEHVHVHDRAMVEAALAEAMRSGTPFELEHRFVTGNGEELIVAHAGRTVEAPDQSARRVIGTALDVTERASIERLRDALIATASHELRTPLTSIVGFSDTLRQRWDDLDESQRRHFVEIIEGQGRRLTHLVEDTLMQSRLDSGSMRTVRAPMQVLAAIERALDMTALEDVAVSCDPGLLAHANIDHVVQVTVNLLTNASKYGAAPIEVRALADEHDATVELRVIDHGPGVAPEFESSLFERFTRGPGTELQPGTGLGLSIVRGLVESNGGTIEYVRHDGVTEFVCRFDAVPSGERAQLA